MDIDAMRKGGDMSRHDAYLGGEIGCCCCAGSVGARWR